MTARNNNLEEALIARALAEKPLAIQDLAVSIGGMYPADLKQLLIELEAKGVVSNSSGIYHATSHLVSQPHTECAPVLVTLLPPHPANMDWRYEEGTARLLAQRSLAETEGPGLFIGSPSALVHWRQLAPGRPALLLDASEIMVSSINAQMVGTQQHALRFDMCRPLDWTEHGQYDVCLSDPPWYREHYLGAIGIASSALRLGGRMLVSLLPPLARPGAIADRVWIIQQAEQLGFHLISLEQNLLRYQTPMFESRSLATVGIQVPAVWRCGDLATFIKVRDVDPDIRMATLAPTATLELMEREFSEVSVRGNIWRLRGPFDDVGTAPELTSIETDDVLGTVSRRYEGRSRIGLWLPDNRVFGIKGRAAFWHALTRLSGTEAASLSSIPEDATIREAHRLLEPLLASYDTKASFQGQIS